MCGATLLLCAMGNYRGPRAMHSLDVVLTTHARRQLEGLGAPARRALAVLQEMSHEEIAKVAESLPAQHGREMWLLWAGKVRILFDIEDGELTVHGFGHVPHR